MGILGATPHDGSSDNANASRPDVKYCSCQCRFLDRAVWAILTRQSDGAWQIVNCLDKHDACLRTPCVFAQRGGQWPFATGPRGPASGKPEGSRETEQEGGLEHA